MRKKGRVKIEKLYLLVLQLLLFGTLHSERGFVRIFIPYTIAFLYMQYIKYVQKYMYTFFYSYILYRAGPL